MPHTVTSTERGGWTVSRTATRTVPWSATLLPGLLDATPDDVPHLFGDLTTSRQRLLIVDSNVWRLYGEQIVTVLARFGVEHSLPVRIPGGESSKDWATAHRIIQAMKDHSVPRFGEPVLVWGGGVLHDVAGVAAALFRRDVPWRFYATTLVAAIDAGFALKVALNEGWKNLVGAYHPAEAMYADPALFAREPAQILDGTGEIIKWALVDPDPETFDYFERHGPAAVEHGFQPDDLHALTIIRRTIEGMMDELAANPYEANPQRRSYIGHGCSQAWEPEVTHGQAVIFDILLTLHIATYRELIPVTLRDRIVRAIRRTGLALWHDVLDEGPGPIMHALTETARHRQGLMSIPTPHRTLGTVTYMQDIKPGEIGAALEDLNRIATTA